LGDISDEFKIDIIYSIKGLLARAPKKFKSILNFLANCLKSESKIQFKKHCLERIEYVMNEVAESKEAGLTHLVEYIEDCQLTSWINKSSLTTSPPTNMSDIFWTESLWKAMKSGQVRSVLWENSPSSSPTCRKTLLICWKGLFFFFFFFLNLAIFFF